MRKVSIPRTPLEPSVICLGTALFGGAIGTDESWRLLDAFVDCGGNFIDTAHVYASWLPGGAGASERTIGEWLRRRGNREAILVGTKGCTLDLSTRQAPAITPQQVTTELGESLERLGTDYVDIYWLHRDNPEVPVAEVLEALAPHLASGRVRAIGASNWGPSRLRDAAECARRRGLTGFCASQIAWSLAHTVPGPDDDLTCRAMDEATYAFHQQTKLPVVAYSSQARGFFAGKGARLRAPIHASGAETGGAMRRYDRPENFERLARAEALAARYGTTPNRVALAYLVLQAFSAVAIVGSRTVAQVRDSCAAGDLRLAAEDVAFLDGRGDGLTGTHGYATLGLE